MSQFAIYLCFSIRYKLSLNLDDLSLTAVIFKLRLYYI